MRESSTTNEILAAGKNNSQKFKKDSNQQDISLTNSGAALRHFRKPGKDGQPGPDYIEPVHSCV